MTNLKTCSLNPGRALVMITFVISLVDMTYMLQLEDKCKRYNLILVIREICTTESYGCSPLLAIIRLCLLTLYFE